MKKYRIQITEIGECGGETPVKTIVADGYLAAGRHDTEWEFASDSVTIEHLINLSMKLKDDDDPLGKDLTVRWA